jgi:hypothetical protein
VTPVADRARAVVAGRRERWLVPLLVIVGLLYPWYEDTIKSLPLIGDFIPSTESMVVMVAFTMMALGLNIVVGFAGLLDLGYVAFYAVGAYTAGWFASQQFDQVTFHFFSSVPDDQPGIHLRWIVLVLAGLLTLLSGVIIGLRHSACGATTWQSSRSGSARSFRRSSTTATRSAVRPHAWVVRHRADRLRGLPDPELRGVAETSRRRRTERSVLRRRVRAPPDHRVLHRSPATRLGRA